MNKEGRYDHVELSSSWALKKPTSTIRIGDDGGPTFEVGVDKKFNWFQKKMIKWCFGFELQDYSDWGEQYDRAGSKRMACK